MAVPDARPEPSRESSGESSIDLRSARIELAPPAVSLVRYAPAAVLIAVLLADSNRHTDPDLWGHLRFGQLFIAGRHLLHHDTYSYSAAGHRWRDHEWLAEVVMAGVYNAAGVAGLKLWKLACTATALLFVADTESSTGAPPTIQLAVLFAAACGFLLQAQFRPQMFTFVLLGALLALLARDNYRRGAARLWLAVPLMALWANLHGGFFIGIAALALYAAVAALCDLAAGAGWRRGTGLSLLTVAAAAATLINPYGIGMWSTVAHALRNPYTRNVVDDWQPLWWALLAQWHAAPAGVVLYLAVIAMVATLAVAWAAAPRGGDLPLAAVAAMMAVAAFLSVRNMALAAMAMSGPLTRHLSMLRARRAGVRRPAAPWRPASHFAMLAVAGVMAAGGGLFSRRLAPDRGYPGAALAFMNAHGLHGNVLNEFGWGEYLIWHAAPADKVFIDGRYDTVYPFKVIRDYLEFYFDEPDAGAVLDSYPHDFVLIELQAPARRLMERRRDWKLLYRDETALVFARARAPAASLPGLPVTATTRPGGFP